MLYKSFSEISSQTKPVYAYFEENTKYKAHSHNKKEFETLFEHTEKVLHYFQKLIQVHQLETVIDTLIKQVSFGSTDIGNFVKNLFYQSVAFHDFGKINDNFQSQRLKNKLFQSDRSIKIGYEHSYLSAYLFLYHQFERIAKSYIPREERSLLYVFPFLFSVPILKHHSNGLAKDYDFENNTLSSLKKFIDIFDFQIDEKHISKILEAEKKEGQNLWSYFENIAEESNFDYFSLFALLKLNYSLLTAADYYATSDYMNDIRPEKGENFFGVIDENLRKAIYKGIRTSKKYNAEVIENPEKYRQMSLYNLQKKSSENLNLLRQKMAAEVLTGLDNHSNERVFYIEAPTGGGKTNMSMLAVYKMLQLYPEINKVFYVFPFTTLVTQTHQSIIETFRLSTQEVAQIHSKASYESTSNQNEIDAQYGDELKNYINHLFVNYPLALMTHIKFFDILKSNEKQTNYLLHRLANSVVVIDELQAYSPKHWDKVKYYISKYAELFNIRFLLMSATLPKLHGIALTGKDAIYFPELIPDAQENYLRNPNFSQRVSIETDLLEKKKIDISELAEIVYEKSENYAENRDDNKGSVFTIIEFIFKKSASEFKTVIEKNELFSDYEIFVLSGTVLEPRRRYIIEFLKDSANRKKKVLLITTQVVEAGVDIDMDLGFKNQSLLDSDEQLAGRINRNVNKTNCELWLFDYNEAKTIYGADFRHEVMKKMLVSEKEEILKEKRFDKLYDLVIGKITQNNRNDLIKNFDDYKELINSLSFEDIHKNFKLIEQENTQIFVPLDVPVHCYGTGQNFSDVEINFLKRNQCLTPDHEYVLGEVVWEVFSEIIEDRKRNFNQRNIDLKILNGIMSKFVFSLFAHSAKKLEEYFDYSEEKHSFMAYQYYRLHSDKIGENNLFSLENGLDESLVESYSSFEII